MQVNDFLVAHGPHTKVASRILYNAFLKKWTNDLLAIYYDGVLRQLSAGKDVEEAILETESLLITLNVEEGKNAE